MRDYRCCRHWAGFRGALRKKKKKARGFSGPRVVSPQFRPAAAAAVVWNGVRPPTTHEQAGPLLARGGLDAVAVCLFRLKKTWLHGEGVN